MLKQCLPLLFCSALAAGCAADGGSRNSLDLAGRSFSWSGGVSESGPAPYISFGRDGSVSGMAGCNRILGRYRQKGSEIDLSQLGTKMMMCAPAVMKSERMFLGYLDKARRAAVSADGSLELLDAQGGRIVLLSPVSATALEK